MADGSHPVESRLRASDRDKIVDRFLGLWRSQQASKAKVIAQIRPIADADVRRVLTQMLVDGTIRPGKWAR